MFFLLQIIPLGFLLYKYFSNRNRRLADSNLLRYKEINREQKEQGTVCFLQGIIVTMEKINALCLFQEMLKLQRKEP